MLFRRLFEKIKDLDKLIHANRRTERDFFIILGVGFVSFFFMAYFDIAEHYNDWVTGSGLRKYQFDDIIFLFAYFGFAGSYFSLRRLQELKREMIVRRKLEKIKDEFLGIVSHELRTPLTTVREGVSQVIDGIHGVTTPEQREFLTIVLEDIERLSRMINNLLDVSKIESGTLQLRRELTDMVEIARQAARLFEPQADAKGLQIRRVLPQTPVPVFADVDKMKQVWDNLIGNALKFTKKGYVEIDVSDDETSVICSVKDTGDGIGPEDMLKIFNRFYQVSKKPVPGQHGTGLGLSIAKALVELHGGTISVQSSLGIGSTFTFVIPKLSPNSGET